MATVIDYTDSVTGGNNWSADPTEIIHSFQRDASNFYLSVIIIYFWGSNPFNVTGATCFTYLADEDGKPTGNIIETAFLIQSVGGATKKAEMYFSLFGFNYSSNTRYCFVLHYDTVDSGPPYENDNGIGQYYYINDVEQTNQLSIEILGDVASSLPSKPTNPTPANSATGVDFSGLQLSWNDGGGADTFDIYIGTTGSPTLVSSAQAGTNYTTTLSELATIFGSDPIDQKIYWRVDATNTAGTTTGDEWNFDARPVKTNTPSPIDAVSDITLDETPLSWVDGGNADTYNVYFGEQGNVEQVASLQADVEWIIIFGTLGYNITYEWRIDSVNDFGVTTGDTWSFDSIIFAPPTAGASGGAGGGGGGGGTGEESSPTGENNMITLRRLIAAAQNKIWYEDV